MAAPISHIIYAKKYLEKNPMREADQELFLLGCSFPDIRRIDENISRRDTHQAFFPINLDFKNLNPFQAGWKFHLYCDMKREEILRDKKFYSLKGNKSEKWIHPGKLLEDKFLYNEYNNWEKLVSYFNNPPKINTKTDVSFESFALWYAMLARYFEKEPDRKSIRIFLIKQHGLPDKVEHIIENLEIMKKNKKAVKILQELISEIIPE